MRVAVYPADAGGCGFYRVIWAAQALANQGADVDVALPWDPPERQLQAAWTTDRNGVETVVDVIAPDADVVVLQRPLAARVAGAVETLQRKGLRVVVEIDDDFTSISRRNVSWRPVDPARNPNRNRNHLARACAAADLVTVSTPALAAVYGAHGRVAVVPNCVPQHYLGIEAEPHDDVFVGWSGSMETHPDDLQVCGHGVARALAATGARFGVVGTGAGVQRALHLADAPIATGWSALLAYPHNLAELDVGIVPLESSRFNEAKSWLKGLEMAALGVPFVASHTGPYRALAAMGAGVLADGPRRWEGIVKRMVREAGWRAELAQRGRDVARGLTIEGNCEWWWDAWALVLDGAGQHPRLPRSSCWRRQSVVRRTR